MIAVREVMTRSPACCTQDTPLRDVARMMRDKNCGSIPVVDAGEKLVGIVTDRDIACRCVAEGMNPQDLTAKDCMSPSPATVNAGASLQECCQVMEEHDVRRVPVVDDKGKCCGIVAQADVALHASPETTGGIVREISDPVR